MKRKILIYVGCAAIVGTSIPANAGIWEDMFSLANWLYRVYNITRVYTLCPGNEVMKELPPLMQGKWPCEGHAIPSSEIGICGTCPNDGTGCDFDNVYGKCCYMSRCP